MLQALLCASSLFYFRIQPSSTHTYASETHAVRTSAIGRFVPAPAGNARRDTKRWERKRAGRKGQRGRRKDFPQHRLANQRAVGQTRCVTSAQRLGSSSSAAPMPTEPAHAPGRVVGTGQPRYRGLSRDMPVALPFGPRAPCHVLAHPGLDHNHHHQKPSFRTIILDPPGQSDCRARRAAARRPDGTG